MDSRMSNPNWLIFGKNVPKQELTYCLQVILLYIVTITCLINLSLKNGNSTLWTSLLSSCVAFLLPCPKIRKGKSVTSISPSTSPTPTEFYGEVREI